ncbi:hypothetical protein BT93_H3403 [Corymbia citriodora subsp. variegata]|nr:hypothetical protein BT93_H3403 [Corymbia citriodora subsp. variegata]
MFENYDTLKWGEALSDMKCHGTIVARCSYSYAKGVLSRIKGKFIELITESVGFQDFTEYENFEECIAFIEDFMVKNGPFDGLLGFSQGAVLAAALPGMQAEGLVLTKVPKVKFLILISGGKLGGSKYGAPPLAANAFSSPVNCPSLHLIGENDFQKPESIDLLDSFVDPMVVHHPEKHTIPSLDDQSLEVVNNFIEKIRNHAATCIATSYGDNINSHL